MNKIAVSLLFAIASVASAHGAGVHHANLAQSVAALNAQSKSQIGVSLLSLSLLSNAGPGRYFPKEMLIANGDWPKYGELQTAGYVTLKVSSGLPDGSAASKDFVSIGLTSTGQQLQAALRGP